MSLALQVVVAWLAASVVGAVVWAIACSPGRREEREMEARDADRRARIAALARMDRCPRRPTGVG